MRISFKHKFIFVSKPKCGSTTIRAALDPFSDIGLTEIKDPATPWDYHMTAKQIKAALGERNIDWNDFFSFVSIRNPWAMLVSNYRYAKFDKEGRGFWDPDYQGESEFPFDSFVQQVFDNRDLGVDNTVTVFAFDNVQLVSRIMMLEHFDVALKEIFNIIGIPYTNPTKRNVSSKGSKTTIQQWFSAKTRRMVEQQYAHDIEIGGYTFAGGYRSFQKSF